MKTRSQTIEQNIINQNQYSVDIDFDYASECWKKNKKSIGNGSYVYICTYTNNNKVCGRKCYKELNKELNKESNYCYIHRNKQV